MAYEVTNYTSQNGHCYCYKIYDASNDWSEWEFEKRVLILTLLLVKLQFSEWLSNFWNFKLESRKLAYNY
jgi:hypothetical protein